jgi:hypothetical protein
MAPTQIYASAPLIFYDKDHNPGAGLREDIIGAGLWEDIIGNKKDSTIKSIRLRNSISGISSF